MRVCKGEAFIVHNEQSLRWVLPGGVHLEHLRDSGAHPAGKNVVYREGGWGGGTAMWLSMDGIVAGMARINPAL